MDPAISRKGSFSDTGFPATIHRKEKDGDSYIYLQCFAHENYKRAYKNTKKNCKSFKLDKSNAVRIGTTVVEPYLSTCPVGLVWFARYCGKMYSRHLITVESHVTLPNRVLFGLIMTKPPLIYSKYL